MKPPVTQHETIDDGRYHAVVNGLGEVRASQFGDYITLYFDVDDENETPITISGGASYKLSSRTKLYRWANALMNGADAEILGGDFDLESLIGRSCEVEIENSENSDGIVYSNVVNVLPAEALPTAQAPF